MAFFSFKGISSNDMPVKILEMFTPSSANQKCESLKIIGRTVPVTYVRDEFDNITCKITLELKKSADFRQLFSWLSGEGKLTTSDEPDKCYTALSVKPISSKRINGVYRSITVQFICSPFIYAIHPTEVSIGSSYTEVNNPGTLYSEPRIEITMGKESVEGILKGDVNFDGKITPVDASMVLKEYSTVSTGGESTLTDEQKQAADMNDDGQITPSDASAILALYGDTSTKNPDLPGRTIIITTNDQELKIGVPDAVVLNGWTITVDSELQMIYYTNADGLKINILQYSTLDLPLLHTGKNYMKYTGNGIQNVNVIVNERWR